MSFWYLASPYSKYPGGLDAAFKLACAEAGRLMRAGVPVFSPIAHTHPIAAECGMDPLDHTIWLPVDQPMVDAASGLILLAAEGWETSVGMAFELAAFHAADKPVVRMEPGHVPDLMVPWGATPILTHKGELTRERLAVVTAKKLSVSARRGFHAAEAERLWPAYCELEQELAELEDAFTFE